MSAEELRAKIREIPDFPKPGILFYDITTLLKDPAAYKEAIDLMLEPYKDERIDLVVGMESRGFIFSAPLAYLLGRRAGPGPQAGQAAGRDDHRRIRPRIRLEHARDPSRRDRARPARPHRRRPARHRRHGQGHDRAGRAPARRGGRPRLPRRARIPQGARSSRWTHGHQRHQVLAGPGRSRGSVDSSGDPQAGTETAPDEAASPPADPSAVDLGRRRFFRQFASELVQTAATVAGAAQALQRASVEAAAGILDPGAGAAMLGLAATAPTVPSAPTGFRTPFREDAGALYLIDQRRLPDTLVEVENKSAGEVAYSIREMIVRGAPAIGPGRGHRPGAVGRARPERPTVRAPRHPSRRRQRPHPGPPDGGQPALGGRPHDGPLRGGRRPVRTTAGRSPTRFGRRPMRSSWRRPPTTAAWPASVSRRCPCRPTGRCASSPIATPGRWPAGSSARRSVSSRRPITPVGPSMSGSTRRARTSRARG